MSTLYLSVVCLSSRGLAFKHAQHKPWVAAAVGSSFASLLILPPKWPETVLWSYDRTKLALA